MKDIEEHCEDRWSEHYSLESETEWTEEDAGKPGRDLMFDDVRHNVGDLFSDPTAMQHEQVKIANQEETFVTFEEIEKQRYGGVKYPDYPSEKMRLAIERS